jgi:hypothetical protein
MPRPYVLDRRGFGLLLVVVTLAILGALALGSFGIAWREFRTSSDLGYAAQAFEAAESGLAAAETAAAGCEGAPPWGPQVGPSRATATYRFGTTILRLNGSLCLLTTVGERLDGTGRVLARRQLGVLGKLAPAADSTGPRFVPLTSRSWVQMY